MPAALRHVTVWSDLEAAGGTCLGSCWPWSALTTSYRADGDDKVSGTIARSSAGADLLQSGRVLRYERADDSIEEWIVQVVRDVYGTDLVTVTALFGPRLWLQERVVIRSGTDVTLSGTGTLSEVLDTLDDTDEWPAWMGLGVGSRDPAGIAYDWNGSTGLQAILALVAAANASDDVRLFGETMRPQFTRTSGTVWTLLLQTAAVAGTPVLAEGKNLSAYAERSDRLQQVHAVLPLGASGATIAGARFLVSGVDTSAKTLNMVDFAYRTEQLIVGYDGQYVGKYVIAPDGDGFAITDSFAATQRLECSSIVGGDFGTDDIVQIADDSSGTAFTELSIDGVDNPRRVLAQGTWTAKTNWARNAQWRAWPGPALSAPADWDEAGTGWTISRDTTAQYVETGNYTLKIVKDAGVVTPTLTMDDFSMPASLLSPGGGSQTWRAGIRYYKTVATAAIRIGITVNGGSSWTSNAGSGTGVPEWVTAEVTASTNSGTPLDDLRIRIDTTSTASGDFYVDRVWLFRDGTDTGDNTLEGSDPARGFYEANRLLRTGLGATTYELGVIDRHRDDPATFPNDALLVNQEARVVVPSRGVDTTLTVAALEVDELRRQRTTAQFGAPRRRLADVL